jgi:hypothetical protein
MDIEQSDLFDIYAWLVGLCYEVFPSEEFRK